MIPVSSADIWLLQYVNFFLSHDYFIIRIPEAKEDIWMANPRRAAYPMVRLTKQPPADEQRSDQVSAAIAAKLKLADQRLELHIGSEAGQEKTERGLRVGVSPRWPGSEELIRDFPGIEKVCRPVPEPELQKELMALTARINQLNAAAMQKAGRYRRSGGIARPGKKPVVTWAVMGFCAAIYLFSLYLSTKSSDAVAIDVLCGAYYKAFVLGMNEWWRLLTAGFVHVSLFHLAMNMMALYYLGTFAESYYGPKKYACLLLGSVISGNLWVLIGQGNTVANGLSGGLYGLMAAVLVTSLANGSWKNPLFRRQFLSLLLINIMISLLPNVSWLSHLGGFIGGLFIAFIISDSAKWKALRRQFAIAGIILAVTLGALAYRSKLDVSYRGTDLAIGDLASAIGLGGYSARISGSLFEYYSEHGY